MKPAALIATLFLSAVAVAHILRALFRADLTIGGFEVPVWASPVAALALRGLAVWLWREQSD